ncbi:aminoglycoside phosphotransferase family protein [Ureibacillus chungkukjangi]|uniref:aminoglycoside phosphotransferase family protein n=1 Tax=Ureibacillus chungkukjangi TaxID=1202712 RepID=UPI00203F9560|nr:aminoglycoside phosphotransferase family protein [Ureibacillus chungkukjangi]MCM3389780.1 aminoglycoside phosphotransferase family protein [Ureibacillus chungkukjangi]
MERLVIVPSSKYVSHELRIEFGHIPPVLLTVKNNTIMYYLSELYKNDSITIAIHEGADLVEQYNNKSRLNINLVDVGKTYFLGETILELMDDHLLDKSQQMIIHLGDTVLVNNDEDIASNCIFVSRVNDPWRWTIIKSKNHSFSFMDKEVLEGNHMAIVGVFHIKYPKFFKEILNFAIQSKDKDIDPFFYALQLYHEQHPMILKEIERSSWLDLGHLDRYYEAIGKTRNFNHTEIDCKQGTILKISENKEKLIHEISWYLNLPNTLQYTIPRIFDFSLDSNEPYVKMEYYGYSPLADRFVMNNLDVLEWGTIFNRLKELLTDFRQYITKNTDLKENRYKMYVQKVISRLNDENFPSELFEINEVNGKTVYSLSECKIMIEKLFEEIYELTIHQLPTQSTIMHGDFCFSNILYDTRTGVIRTIDPRGSFGEISIYGDPLYDIAKLSHSIRGQYDFLVREQFYFEQNRNCVTFEVYSNNHHEKIASIFEEIFLYNPETKLFVDFIEATLFLSMLPLHSDSLYRQKGLLVTGLMKFTDVVEKVKTTINSYVK